MDAWAGVAPATGRNTLPQRRCVDSLLRCLHRQRYRHCVDVYIFATYPQAGSLAGVFSYHTTPRLLLTAHLLAAYVTMPLYAVLRLPRNPPSAYTGVQTVTFHPHLPRLPVPSVPYHHPNVRLPAHRNILPW